MNLISSELLDRGITETCKCCKNFTIKSSGSWRDEDVGRCEILRPGPCMVNGNHTCQRWIHDGQNRPRDDWEPRGPNE